MIETLQLGGFVLRTELLVQCIAGAAAYGAIMIRYRKQRESISGAMDVLVNAVLILLLIWKAGAYVFNPEMWDRPQALLFMTGTLEDVWLGAFIAAAYMAWRIAAGQTTTAMLADLFAYGVLTWITIWQGYEWYSGAGWVSGAAALASSLGWCFIAHGGRQAGEGRDGMAVLGLLAVVIWVGTMLGVGNETIWLVLTPYQWLALLFGCTAYILYRNKKAL